MTMLQALTIRARLLEDHTLHGLHHEDSHAQAAIRPQCIISPFACKQPSWPQHHHSHEGYLPTPASAHPYCNVKGVKLQSHPWRSRHATLPLLPNCTQTWPGINGCRCLSLGDHPWTYQRKHKKHDANSKPHACDVHSGRGGIFSSCASATTPQQQTGPSASPAAFFSHLL